MEDKRLNLQEALNVFFEMSRKQLSEGAIEPSFALGFTAALDMTERYIDEYNKRCKPC